MLIYHQKDKALFITQVFETLLQDKCDTFEIRAPHHSHQVLVDMVLEDSTGTTVGVVGDLGTKASPDVYITSIDGYEKYLFKGGAFGAT